jgi:DNA replication protein DnaC
MATRTKPSTDIAYLCRAMKAPSLARSVERLAERARTESWTHEEFLAACLEREVAARQDHGGEGRIRAARFPARKTLEDFDFSFQRSLKRDVVAHLGTLNFIAEQANVVFLGPPGTGKTHLAIGISIRACQAGHRVAFATAAEWVARLGDAHTQGRLHDELRRLGRTPLLVIDEVGYIPSSRSRQPLLPTRLQPIRARQCDRHQQQAIRPMGRSLRRRHRRSRHDRPTRPPR